jgi:hypothetical protein
MEVHHPHHPTHKKKWSEYIIEFVMLFTAVTLGFFAENIREHLAESHKKQETLEAVARDFEKDINQLKFHKSFDLNKIKICDSIDNILTKDPNLIDQQDYYRLINSFMNFWKFNTNSRSRIESESKGYFSDKENQELAYYISKYNFYLMDFTNNAEMEQEYYMDFYNKNNLIHFVDAEIYKQSAHFPRSIIPHKIGIRQIKPEYKEDFKLYTTGIRVMNEIGLYNIDSLQFYAKKAINLINKKN